MAEQKPKETKEEKAIVAANMQMNGAGIEIRTLQDAKLVAETFISSHLVPEHFDTAAKVIVAIQAGFELGFKPWQALHQLHVIKGKVGISSQAIEGLIRSSGKAKYMKHYFEGREGTDNFAAVVESQRVDDPTIHKSVFSVADAKTAELWGTAKDNWKKYPKRMLNWRALSNHGKDYYGDVICGFYTLEELREIHPPTEATTADVPSREERKQAEDVKITDTQETIKNELEKVIDVFSTFAGHALGGIDSAACLSLTAFAKMAELATGETEADFTKTENYTLEHLKLIQTYIEREGIPDDILALIPQPEEQTVEQVEQACEEKLAEFKYQCAVKKCGHLFDIPAENNLCPKCFSKKIETSEQRVARLEGAKNE